MSRHQRPRQSVLRPRRLAAPPLRFFLPLTVLVTLLALMVLRGMANNEVFHDEKVAVSVDKGTVPESVLRGGPVVDSRGAKQDAPVSYTVPDKTVVLTFDDGPSTDWTPKILDVLAKEHIQADFFVTGSMTTRNPALIRRIVAEGHEIGVHTYTHPDLALHNNMRLDWELGETQLALAGVAGIHSSLFRPPYSSTADALDDWSWPVTKAVGKNGYLVAFIDKDTDDWKRPGVNAIVKAAMPDLAGQGEMILLHDAAWATGRRRWRPCRSSSTSSRPRATPSGPSARPSAPVRRTPRSAAPHCGRARPSCGPPPSPSGSCRGWWGCSRWSACWSSAGSR